MSNIENVILLHGGGLSYEVANQIINKLPPSINVRTISMSKSKDFQAALLGSGNNESTPIQQQQYLLYKQLRMNLPPRMQVHVYVTFNVRHIQRHYLQTRSNYLLSSDLVIPTYYQIDSIHPQRIAIRWHKSQMYVLRSSVEYDFVIVESVMNERGCWRWNHGLICLLIRLKAEYFICYKIRC